MSDKAMIWMGAALLALGLSGCSKPVTKTKTVTRKPLDTKKPLAPQLSNTCHQQCMVSRHHDIR